MSKREVGVDSYFIINKIPSYSFFLAYISGVMQFSSLWDISYEYVRFFSIAQLIQDMIVILPIFTAVLLAIYFYYMIGVIDNIYQFFVWLNDKNKYFLNKEYLKKYLLRYVSYFLICAIFFYAYMVLFFKTSNVYESIIFFIASLISFTFLLANMARAFCLLNMLMASKKIEFDKKFLDESFYLKFGKMEYWFNFLKKQYLEKKIYESVKEIDFIKPDIASKALVVLIITYLAILINNLLLDIDRSFYENVSLRNINTIKMEEKIMNDYKLNEKPIFLYMNSNYIFYDINIQNRVDRKKDKQIILIIKRDDLFE